MKRIFLIVFACILAAALVAYATSSTPEQKRARYLSRGNSLYEQGQYAKARVEYKNAARISPADAEIDYRMGLLDEAESDYRNAFVNFSHAEQQDAHYHPAQLKVANYYMAVEQYEQTQKRIDAVLADTPDDPEAHALRAALLLRHKNFALAEQEARLALSKDPANISATCVLVGLYMSVNDITSAEKVLEEGIVRSPRDLSLLLLKVKIHEKPLQLTEVAQAYQQIFKLRPHDPQFRIYLSNAYLEAGEKDQAEAVLRDAIAVQPEDWSLKYQLVLFLDKQRGLQSAENEILLYKQSYPNKEELYFWLVDLYMRRNEIDKAVAVLEQVASRNAADNNGLNAQASLARIHYMRGEKALAEKLLSSVLQKVPSNRDALLTRANIEADQGLYENAISDLRIILHDHSQDKDALKLISEMLQLEGHTDLAIETLNELLETDLNDSNARIRLAQLYDTNGNGERGLELLSIVTQAEPFHAIAWETTARVAINQKDFPRAWAAIHTLDALPGQHLTATFLGGLADEARGKYDEAIYAYKRVIDSDSSSALSEHALSALKELSFTRPYLKTTIDYLEAIKIPSPTVSTVLGECYAKGGIADKAALAFDRAIAGNPHDQSPYIGRAALYMLEHKYDDALTILHKAELAVPSDLRAPVREADIMTKLGRYNEAIKLYGSILERNPALDIIANNMAALIANFAYDNPILLEKARLSAERFIGAKNPMVIDTLGWVYYRQEKIGEALEVLAPLAKSGALQTPELHYHYGAVLAKAGKPNEAISELIQAVDGGDFSGKDDARKILETLKNK